MNPSTHPKCFFSGASSITKSEPTGKPAGPRDLAFDEFRNGEKTVRHELINYRKPAPVKHSCCFQSGVTWCSRCSHRVTHTIRNGERGAKFFAAREALAGCRGAALTRRFCGAAACGGSTKHILSPHWVTSSGSRLPSALRRSAPFLDEGEKRLSAHSHFSARTISALHRLSVYQERANAITYPMPDYVKNHVTMMAEFWRTDLPYWCRSRTEERTNRRRGHVTGERSKKSGHGVVLARATEPAAGQDV